MTAAAAPLHQRIRDAIEGRILSGEWSPGHRIPFEHELTAEFQCSRMTVNKVLASLAAKGLITRKRRSGSVVAEPRPERAILEIQDFAEEASRTGAAYRFEIQRSRIRTIPAALAERLSLKRGTPIREIDLRHLMNGEPVAVEQRLINLDAVPEARHEKFTEIPPGSWLLRQVPWSEAEHVIRAIPADAATARLLSVAPGDPCLALERRTWQAGTLITEARLLYPGNRFHFVGRFQPGEGRVG